MSGKDEATDQELIEKADAATRDLFPHGGRLTEEQSAKFAAYLEEGMREEWEAELAAEAGVLEVPERPPIPDDHPCCPMCRERGAASIGIQFDAGTGEHAPLWNLPQCAFPPPGPHTAGTKEGLIYPRFNPDNWACGALSKIRDLAGDVEVWNEDQHAAILPWCGDDRGGDYLVVSYYKHRGKTEGLWVLSESTMEPATYDDVVQFLHDQRCADARRILRERDGEVEAQWDDVRCGDCGAVPDLVLIQKGPEYRCTCGWRQLGPSPRLWRHLSHE